MLINTDLHLYDKIVDFLKKIHLESLKSIIDFYDHKFLIVCDRDASTFISEYFTVNKFKHDLYIYDKAREKPPVINSIFDTVLFFPPMFPNIDNESKYSKSIVVCNKFITKENRSILCLEENYWNKLVNKKTKLQRDELMELISISAEIICKEVQNVPDSIELDNERNYIFFNVMNIDIVSKEKTLRYLNFENYYLFQLDGILLYEKTNYEKLRIFMESTITSNFEFETKEKVKNYILKVIDDLYDSFTFIPKINIEQYYNYINNKFPLDKTKEIDIEMKCDGDTYYELDNEITIVYDETINYNDSEEFPVIMCS